MPADPSRAIFHILQALCRERGIDLHTLADGWVLRLSRPPVVRYVHGYTFDLNGAASHALACDKAAACQALAHAGLPHVPHRLFLNTELARFGPHAGNWAAMLDAFEAMGRDAVVKDNLGTGGFDVVRVRSPLELEVASQSLFTRGRHVAMCPWIDILEETRLVMLGDECLVSYAKVRASVTGDGKRRTIDLLADDPRAPGLIAGLDAAGLAGLLSRPAAGEARPVDWRHNLGRGATPQLRPPSDTALRLARGSMAALGLHFASIDIVETPQGLNVMEANSGVMVEALAATPEGLPIARAIYDRALDRLFPKI